MKKQIFDEYQMSIRNKLYFKTLSILIIAVFINGFYSHFFGEWTDYLTQTMVILYIPLGYFVIFAVLNNVYFSKEESLKRRKSFMYSSLFIGFLNLYTTISSLLSIGLEHFIKNGYADSTIVMPITAIYWLSLGFSLLYQNLKSKNDTADV